MLALHERIQSKHAVIKLGREVPIRMSLQAAKSSTQQPCFSDRLSQGSTLV